MFGLIDVGHYGGCLTSMYWRLVRVVIVLLKAGLS